jgi:Chloride channel protein EriC
MNDDDNLPRPAFFRIFVLATATGCLVGIVAAAFRLAIDHGYAGFVMFAATADAYGFPGWLAAPLAGAVLVTLAVFLTRRFAPEAAGSGIQYIEGTMKGVLPPIRWRRIVPVKFASGLAAMSAGLVLGREGPSIHLGGAIGAMIGHVARVSDEHRHALSAAGAGAGLTVAFNAPVGGILFVAEEMRDDITYTHLVAQYVVVASILATVAGGLILGLDRVLLMPPVAEPTAIELLLAVVFAIGVGVFGVFLNGALLRTIAGMRHLADRLGWMTVSVAVGVAIGLLVWAYPDATGGGEVLTAGLVTGELAPKAMIVLLVVRLLVFLVSYGTGTPGGIFAPQLAFGAILGLLFAAAVDHVAPGVIAEPTKFAVAGMAGVLTATVRAPLTGFALVLEMTGSINLIFMMLVVALTCAATAELLGGRPIYKQMLERLTSDGVQAPASSQTTTSAH